MKHIYEIGLIAGIILLALAFGGTETPYFSVVQLMFLGLSFLLLSTHNLPMTRDPKLPVLIPFLLVVFVLAQCVQFPSLGNSPDTIASSAISVAPYETLSHFLIMVTYLAAFYLTIFVYRQSNGGRRLIFALLGLGAFEACYGLFQYLTGWQQIFWYVKTVNLEMATGTYINYNHFAGLLEMILPFALACSYDQYQKIPSSHSPARRLRRFFLHEESHKLILWLFLAIVFLVAIVFSESRMGLVSAVISTFCLVILVIPFGQQRIAVANVTLAILAAVLAMVIWIGPEPVINRFLNLSPQQSGPAGDRKAIWRDTVQLIDGHPWLGTGLGTFPLAYPSAQTAFAGKFVNHAHNDYLEFASELGIPATVLLFGGVFYVLLQSAKTFRGSKIQFEKTIALGCFGSLFAISLHSLTDFNLQIPANALLFAVVLGLAHANSAARRAPSTATIACNVI